MRGTRLTGGTYRSRSASRDGQGTWMSRLGSGTSKRVLNWVWVSRCVRYINDPCPAIQAALPFKSSPSLPLTLFETNVKREEKGEPNPFVRPSSATPISTGHPEASLPNQSSLDVFGSLTLPRYLPGKPLVSCQVVCPRTQKKREDRERRIEARPSPVKTGLVIHPSLLSILGSFFFKSHSNSHTTFLHRLLSSAAAAPPPPPPFRQTLSAIGSDPTP